MARVKEFVSINPWNDREEARFSLLNALEVEGRATMAGEAYQSWRRVPLDERVALLATLETELMAGRDAYAELITREMGKPITESKAEIDKCAALCRHVQAEASRYLADDVLNSGDTTARVIHDPIGAIVAVMPWNFPFWQVLRCAVPALMAGNTMLLKHAPNVSGCALALHKLFREAGFPTKVFQSLIMDVAHTERLLVQPEVQGVAVTGSTRAGGAVAALAGKYGKRSVLELGGSDPFLVMPDADIAAASDTAVRSRFANAGQSCIAANRIYIQEGIYDRLVAALSDSEKKKAAAELKAAYDREYKNCLQEKGY